MYYCQGIVYGSITINYQGDNKVYIHPDEYNFEMHYNIEETVRNIETLCASIVHGIGRPFHIIFKGLNTIQK